MKGIMDRLDSESAKKWYDEYPKSPAPCEHTKSEFDVLTLKTEAKKHLDGETAAFQLKQSKSRDSEFEWLKTALSKGTSADKIAASIVLIQDNPKYNLSRLTALISQVKGSKHTQSNLLITSLRDLFISDLLHPKFKLLKFEEQDLNQIPSSNELGTGTTPKVPRNKLLSHWYFEDSLREHYEKFITALSAVASDTVDANREKAIAVMNELLIANSEQEHKLLESLVNKIGDPRSKVASKTVFCLNKLLLEHPNMKIVVLREIEKLLFRKNIAPRAQYYAICLLSKFILTREDTEAATTLIDIYFAFFKACLKKGEPDSRMMSAILAGVNRAYSFADLTTIKLAEHIDSVYKVVHVGSFNVSLNALSLLQQVVQNNPAQENRFYTALYRRLLYPQIGIISNQAIFLNLLHRAMKSDKSVIRLGAFVKRIRQIALQFPASMTYATLYIVQEICQSRKDLKHLLSTQPIVIKKEKGEVDEESTDQPALNGQDNDDNEDNDDDDDDVQIEENTITLPNVISKAPVETETETDPEKEDIIKLEEDTSSFYDPFQTNPLKAGASKAAATELVAFSRHYHPSVALIANTNIKGKNMPFSGGDPLKDLSLIRFLDRFAFKNPKKINERVVNNDPLSIRANYTSKGIRSIPVDSEAYRKTREELIPPDELFLHQFLKQKYESRPDKDEDSDQESVNSEEFNDMLDNLTSAKDLEELDIAADLTAMKKHTKKKEKVRKQSSEDQSSDEESVDDLYTDASEKLSKKRKKELAWEMKKISREF